MSNGDFHLRRLNELKRSAARVIDWAKLSAPESGAARFFVLARGDRRARALELLFIRTAAEVGRLLAQCYPAPPPPR
jgi:hypothetical protein